jgi:hypothetical protein
MLAMRNHQPDRGESSMTLINDRVRSLVTDFHRIHPDYNLLITDSTSAWFTSVQSGPSIDGYSVSLTKKGDKSAILSAYVQATTPPEVIIKWVEIEAFHKQATPEGFKYDLKKVDEMIPAPMLELGWRCKVAESRTVGTSQRSRFLVRLERNGRPPMDNELPFDGDTLLDAFEGTLREAAIHDTLPDHP